MQSGAEFTQEILAPLRAPVELAEDLAPVRAEDAEPDVVQLGDVLQAEHLDCRPKQQRHAVQHLAVLLPHLLQLLSRFRVLVPLALEFLACECRALLGCRVVALPAVRIDQRLGIQYGILLGWSLAS
jgi:hypothetical protein